MSRRNRKKFQILDESAYNRSVVSLLPWNTCNTKNRLSRVNRAQRHAVNAAASEEGLQEFPQEITLKQRNTLKGKQKLILQSGRCWFLKKWGNFLQEEDLLWYIL